MSVEFPTSPADIPYDADLAVLVKRYHEHAWALTGQRRYGPQPVSELAAHAVAALAVQHVIADRVLYGRWINVGDALAFGATVEQVAKAMGLDEDEVRGGLGRWVDGMVRVGHFSPAQRDAVLDLLSPPEPADPVCSTCGSRRDATGTCRWCADPGGAR